MLPSVNIRLSYKILVLLSLCATLIPSIESQPRNEVGKSDTGLISSTEKPNNALTSVEPKDYNGATSESEQASTKSSRSKSKTKPKSKRKNKRIKTGMGKTSQKPKESSTEPSTENSSMSSEKSDKPGTGVKLHISSTKPYTENMSESSESHGMEEKTKEPGMKGNPEKSSTEPCTENTSESSEKSEKHTMKGNPEESSTGPCTENMSDSCEKSEKCGMECDPEESCTENMTESSKTSKKPGMEEESKDPCMEEMHGEPECGKMIKGQIAPVFTPIGKYGEIDYSAIPKYTKYLKDIGISVIVVGGTTGEAMTMSSCERKLLLECWMEETKKLDIKVIVQVGGTDEPSVIDMARHAQEVGACGILLLPQLYYKPKNTEELVFYMETISKQASKLSLIYYDFPMMSGVTVNMTELFYMATKRIRNFKGVKSDLNTIFEVGSELQDNQLIYLGNHQIASAALMGHESSIATVNNIFPDLVKEIIEAINYGDVKKAKSLQMRLNKIIRDITRFGEFQATMKMAFEIKTDIKIGPVRMPLYPLEEEKRKYIREAMIRNGVQVKW